MALLTRGGELWWLPLPWQTAQAPPLGMSVLPGTAPSAVHVVTPQLLVQGHSTALAGRWCGDASALATDPSNGDAFATGGDDGTVRVWSVARRRLVALRQLPLPVTSLAYSSDGAHLATGCASGGIYILHADSLADALLFTLLPAAVPKMVPPSHATFPTTVLGAGSSAVAASQHLVFRSAEVALDDTLADATATAPSATFGSPAATCVSVLAYSPDDRVLAVGGPNGSLEFLEVNAHYRRLHTCRGHSAAVLHLDWSTDGRFVQSVCSGCEYFFWDTATGERIADAAAMRDVEWATWSCPLGLPVRGIYPKLSDGSDITAVHRSPDGCLLVSSDDYRKVNLFAYPCGPGSAACRSVAAHGSHVANVRFTANGHHVISLGGADLSVMVWRLTRNG